MGKSKVNFKMCERRRGSNHYGSPIQPELYAWSKEWIINEKKKGIAMSAIKIRIKA